jgi:hypothetical protein
MVGNASLDVDRRWKPLWEGHDAMCVGDLHDGWRETRRATPLSDLLCGCSCCMYCLY